MKKPSNYSDEILTRVGQLLPGLPDSSQLYREAWANYLTRWSWDYMITLTYHDLKKGAHADVRTGGTYHSFPFASKSRKISSTGWTSYGIAYQNTTIRRFHNSLVLPGSKSVHCFAVREKGGRFGRSHWHSIVGGVTPDDLDRATSYWREVCGFTLATKFTAVNALNVAKYLSKDLDFSTFLTRGLDKPA